MSKYYSPAYLQQFPEVVPIDQPPALWKMRVRKMPTPVYTAGWSLKNKEVMRKFNGECNTFNVASRLKRKWRELGFDKKLASEPYLRSPRVTLHNTRDILIVFAQNGLEGEMKFFEKNTNLVFDIMCQLFEIKSQESIDRIQRRFKWYRNVVDKYDVPLEVWRTDPENDLFLSDWDGSDSEDEDSESSGIDSLEDECSSKDSDSDA